MSSLSRTAASGPTTGADSGGAAGWARSSPRTGRTPARRYTLQAAASSSREPAGSSTSDAAARRSVPMSAVASRSGHAVIA